MAGDPRDYVLHPKEILMLRGRGLAALQAIGTAAVRCSISQTEPILGRPLAESPKDGIQTSIKTGTHAV